jgi:hypothetical protein
LATHLGEDSRGTLPVAWNAWWMHVGEPGGNPKGYYPPTYKGPWEAFDGDATLFYYLLPYLDQGNLFNESNGQQLFSYAPDGAPLWSTPLKIFVSPLDPSPAQSVNLQYSWLEGNASTSWACTSYAGNYQVFGVRGSNAYSYSGWGGTYDIGTIPDGASNTIFFTEKLMTCGAYGNLWAHGGWAPDYAPFFASIASPNAKFQVRPTQSNCDHTLATAFTVAGVLAALGDGSVRTVSPNVSAQVWGWAVDPADGQSLGGNW